MRSLFASFLVICALPVTCLAQEVEALDKDEVLVGVRVDAKPFVWWDENTKGYNGFVYDLCLKTVTRAGYLPVEIPVDSQKRADFFESGAGDYDLLCDPTTLTLQRALSFTNPEKRQENALNNFQFSPIYYLANGGHVELTPKGNIEGKGAFSIKTEKFKEDGCDKIVHDIWNPPTSQTPGISEKGADISDDDEDFLNRLRGLIQLRYRRPDEQLESSNANVAVWGYVDGTSIEKRVKSDESQPLKDRTEICVIKFKTHQEAAARFCEGFLARYYGDLDIIRATIADYAAPNSPCSYSEPSEQERTYEPYAFVLSSARQEEFPRRFVAALYGLFHDGSVRIAHSASFPGVEITSYLNTLYQINDVPSGEHEEAVLKTGRD